MWESVRDTLSHILIIVSDGFVLVVIAAVDDVFSCFEPSARLICMIVTIHPVSERDCEHLHKAAAV